MNLIDVTKSFATEDQCLDFLEGMRWPKIYDSKDQRLKKFNLRDLKAGAKDLELGVKQPKANKKKSGPCGPLRLFRIVSGVRRP